MKEAWDFKLFVRHYNRIAKERGGWVWPEEISEEKLREWYGKDPLSQTLEDFAQGRYELDQEVS